MSDQLFGQEEFGGIETLPPAGYARDEELKRRADTLEEKIAATTDDRAAIPQDHDALRPDRNREIQFAISENYLEVGVNHPYLAVKWVNYKNQDGNMVWKEKSRGWMVATIREFPEAAGLSKEDSTIRVGDVLLMCIPKDRHLLLEQKDRQKALRQQYGIEAEIHDFARRNPAVIAGVSTPEVGITGHLGPAASKMVENMESRSAVTRAARRTAATHLGNKMKTGTIPGVPIK
jgi:hypothetical protein